MSDFDLQPADEAPPKATGYDLQPTETAPAEGDNLGVYPLPSKAQHMALLDEIKAGKSVDIGGGMQLVPASLTAYQAARGPAPEQAAKALQLAKARGVSPQWALENAEPLQQAEQQSGFEDALGVNPVLAAYASRSPVHASAVKDDVGPLQALEMGLLDVRYALKAARQHASGTVSPADAHEMTAYEQLASEYGSREPGFVAQLVRAVPNTAAFVAGTLAGTGLGGPVGGTAGTSIALYHLNRGVLYRKMLAESPIPPADERALASGRDVSDAEYAQWTKERDDFEKLAKDYADKGAAFGGIAGALLGDSFTRALPGANALLQKVGQEMLAKALTRTLAEAAIKRGSELTGHTLSGVAMMATQAAIDDAAVQKATTGEIDTAKALHAGGRAIGEGWKVALALSAATPGAAFLGDLGRIHDANLEAGRIDHLADNAKASKLRQRAPDEFGRLTGEMAARSDAPTVYIDGEAALKDPEIAATISQALRDEGRALHEAKATGGTVAVPTEDYLTALADHHDALREDVKLSPDGLTVRQAEEWQKMMADISEPLNVGKLSEIAARGLRRAPTDAEIRATLDNLRSLGFKVPELAEVAKNGEPVLEPHPLAAALASLPPEDQAGVVKNMKPQPAPEHADLLRGRSVDDWAAELVDGKPIGEIQPGRFDLDARRAADQVASIATEAGEKGVAAARQGFLGAAVQKLRTAVESAAGIENLKSAGKKADAAERRLAKLPALEMSRDLSRAIAARAETVRAEMDRARSYIESRDVPQYRADLALAGPEYLGAFDAIREAMDDNTPRAQPNPQALEVLLARMERDGQLVGFDTDGIRSLLTGDRGWKTLTPVEARNVYDAVKNIRRAAHDANEVRLSDGKYTLREFIGSVTAEASTRKDLGPQPLTRSTETAGEAIARTASVLNAANLKPETIFDRLGETAHRFYEDQLIGARNAKAELYGQHLRHFVENFDKQMRALRKWMSKPVETSLTIPDELNLDTKMNRETLSMALLNLGTAGNEQRLTSGYGWDPASIREEIGKHLTRDKLDMLQGILSYNDEVVWPLVRDHAEKGAGIAPPKVVAQEIEIPLADGTTWRGKGGYFPAAPNRDALGTPEALQRGIEDGVNTDSYARATVQASFTKERAKQASYAVDLNWSRYPAHLASVFHYLAYDEPVRNVGKLLRDQEFQRTVKRYVGDAYLDQLKQDQRIWARGTVGDASGVLDAVSRMFGSIFRTRAVSNALAFSAPIALGQESHVQYAIASGEISLKNATAALSRQLPGTDTWTLTSSLLDEVRFRSDRYADQFREAISGQPSRTLLGHGTDRAAFAMMEAADAHLSHIVGDAALNDALGAGMPVADAIREANRKVRLLMPTHNLMEMAPIVRSRGMIGALLLFRGLPNVVWNVESGLYDQAAQGLSGASEAGQLTRAGGRVALNTARAMGSLAVLHMVGRLLMGHGKNDDDGEGLAGWATWAEREAISAQFSRIPFGRDVAEPFIDAWVHDKGIGDALKELQDGQHLAPDVAVVYNVLKNLGTVANDEKENEDRVQAAVDTALTVLGAGGRPITRGPRYLYDLHRGNVDARGPFDVLGGTVYGSRRTKNPLTAIQDAVSGE